MLHSLTQNITSEQNTISRFTIHQNPPFLGGRIQNVVDTQTNQPVPWPIETAVGAAAFTPNQKLLILATFDGYLRFFAQDTP